MTIKNTNSAYGWLTISLHWIAAFGYIWLYFTGRDVEVAWKAGTPREDLIPIVRYHVSIGLIFISFLAARVYFHYKQQQPAALPQHRFFARLAKIVKHMLLATIVIQIVTGPLILWLNGNPLRFFDLFLIPSPLPKMETLHRIIEVIHIVTGKLIPIVFVLHFAGVLKHLIIDRDRTLQRMMWVKKSTDQGVDR